MESLDNVKKVVTEAGEAIKDSTRNISTSSIPTVLGAAAGAGVGAAASFGALFALGTAGVSAAGITSGLAAAGAIVGGGMVAGIGVLAAPVAILAVGGYGALAHFKHKKVLAVKQALYREALEKHNKILEELKHREALNSDRIEYLERINILLTAAIKDLKQDIDQQAA